MAASLDTPRSGSDPDLPKPAALDEKTSEEIPRDAHQDRPKEAVEPPTGSETPSGDEYLPLRQLLPVFSCVYIAITLIALDRTIIATAIPAITDTFNSIDDIEWYAAGYMLTVSCFMLVYGRLYGFYSPKWIFLISIFIFEVGSAVCGAAPTSTAFIVGRAVAGLGGAGAFSGAMIIIVHTVPLHKRPMYSGFLGSAFMISSVAGPLIGGAFTSSSATWRWCFYINLPFGALAMAVIALVLPKLPAGEGSTKPLKEQLQNLDPFGLLFFLPSMVCLLLALQWGGNKYPWSDGRLIALLVVFAVTFIGFVAVQLWKGDMGTVPPRILKQRSIAAGSWYVFCCSSSMMAIIYWIPVYFQAIQGVSAVESGIRMLPMILGLVVFSMITGIAVRYIGYYVPFMIASSIIQSVACGLLTTFSPSTPEGQWIGYQVLYGAGMGLGMQQAGVAAQTVLSKADVSIGISIVFFVQQLGGAIWNAIAQYLFNQKLASGLAQVSGFDVGVLANTGATNIRNMVPAAQLPLVLQVYSDAIDAIFQSALGITCASIIGAVLMEWKSTKAELHAAEAAKRAAEEKA